MPSTRRPSGPQPVRGTPPQDEPQRRDEAVQNSDHPGPRLPPHAIFARAWLTPLLTTSEPYLSDEYVHKFGIRRRRLDIFSGLAMRPGTQQPASRSTAFMRPMALDDVRTAVEEKRPWISSTYGSSHSLSWDENIDNWWQAYWIAEHIMMYARSHSDEWKLGLVYSTGWEGMRLVSGRMYPSPFPSAAALISLASILCEYKLHQQDALDNPTVKWGAMNGWIRDTPEPHVVCTLSDIAPLRDGQVSVAELRTILTLSGMRARDEGHWDQRVIPVRRVPLGTPYLLKTTNPALGHRHLGLREAVPRRHGHRRQQGRTQVRRGAHKQHHRRLGWGPGWGAEASGRLDRGAGFDVGPAGGGAGLRGCLTGAACLAFSVFCFLFSFFFRFFWIFYCRRCLGTYMSWNLFTIAYEEAGCCQLLHTTACIMAECGSFPSPRCALRPGLRRGPQSYRRPR